MRVRIGAILTTITMNVAGHTTKVTGITRIMGTTTIGITTTIAANLLTGPGQKPGPANHGRSSVLT
jgi:hypothetical protein